MAEADDIAVGKCVLEKQLVAREALLDCLFETVAERRGERGRAFQRPLGVILLERGRIDEQQLLEILGDRFAPQHPVERVSGMRVGELLVGLGYVRREQVADALAIQERAHGSGAVRPRLGEILVERGAATPEQVARALSYQMKEVYRCTRCAVRVNLARPERGRDYACQRCGGPLVPAEAGALTVHDSTVVRPRSVSPTPERPAATDETGTFAVQYTDAQMAEIDRAVEVYARQKGLVRRESLRDARRVQMEISRYGIAVALIEVLRRLGAITWQQHQTLEKMDFADVVRRRDWTDQEVPGYRLLDRIAAGGFGIIHTAQPLFGQSKVVLKILRRERASEASSVARLKREAALLRRFDHPQIIKGVEYGHHGQTHYLVMEYFEGLSLGQVVAESRGLAPQTAVTIVRQVAGALDYLRREGWIHRDVKPDNVLVDGANRVKLCDLGFATELTSNASAGAARPTTVGTAGYMSPEQARGEAALGIGTDLYALGITLYAMLAGFEPFSGASSEVMVSEYVEGGLPQPDLLRLKAPPAVVELVRRMTHRDRLQRFPTYIELAGALDRLGI